LYLALNLQTLQAQEGELMKTRPRILPIVGIFILVTVAWGVLSGTMLARSSMQENQLESRVGGLWGKPQTQVAPEFQVHWTTKSKKEITVYNSEKKTSETKTEWEEHVHQRRLSPSSARIHSKLGLDERRKGLVWFPLYTVDFSATYGLAGVDFSVLDEDADNVEIEIVTKLPAGDGTYDAFSLAINGEDVSADAQRKGGALWIRFPADEGGALSLDIAYVSRGLETWKYRPLGDSKEPGLIEDFSLTMETDFKAIDFPGGSMSPSSKSRTDDGWQLAWDFDRIMTGQTIGMVIPERVQPGELGAKLSASAPISLGFFTVVLYVLAFMRGYRIHPVHYAFVGAAFFSFHLLFAYTADHLPVEWAFAISSITSMVLVVSYLRLVVSNRFAFGPVALAQLIYLVGFGVAHFFTGLTGLAITVLGIVTLFGLMQLTGRIDWFESGPSEPEIEPPLAPSPV
jgi:inner membrane protein involved in colicin E2 resistance